MNLSELLYMGKKQPTAPHLSFTLRHKRIQYTAFCVGVRAIAALHERGNSASVGEGLLIVGQSGGGKSAIAEFYETQFPRSTDGGGTVVPVLRFATPEAPTVKSFAQAMLAALGCPAFDRGTAEAKTHRLVLLLKKCKVELILIDEFQHFADGPRKSEARRITDWVKNLLNKVRIPIVLFGLPSSIGILRLNPQLRRRFAAPLYLKPFGITDGEFGELRAVLKIFHRELPVPCIPLHDADVARRFYFASHGLIDYIVHVLDAAVSESNLKPGEQLGLEHLAQAFRAKVWGVAPDSLNPFCKGATLRLLRQPHEPFDKWEDPNLFLGAAKRVQGKQK